MTKKVIHHQNNVTEKPLVSVSVVTYNHENYIKQCLDGIIFQKTDFDFELLLGEDSSTDNTRDICIHYANKYPNIIRLFLHHRENNIIINGKPSGRFNMIYNITEARGKYIALCEGDDYWSDPYKLQKQVNFLEVNPDFGLVHTNYSRIREDGKILLKKRWHSKKELKMLHNTKIEDLLLQKISVWTGTTCFRREYAFDKRLNYAFNKMNLQSGDFILWSIIAAQSKTKFINDLTAVRRLLFNSRTQGQPHEAYLNFAKTDREVAHFIVKSFKLSEHITQKADEIYFSKVLNRSFFHRQNELFQELYIDYKKEIPRPCIIYYLMEIGLTNSMLFFILATGIKIYKKLIK